MKAGDMVRFRRPSTRPWKLGLLIKYETWEKVATVLHDGNLLRVRAQYIQKAGKKDCLH